MLLSSTRGAGFESPERIKVSEIQACANMTFENDDDLIQMIVLLDSVIMEHWQKEGK